MNKASRIAATINFGANPFQIRASLFHCTPVLERRKGTNWYSGSSSRSSSKRFNQYRRRLRKQSVLHNVSDFTEHIFQNWNSGRNAYDQPGGCGNSWYRPNFKNDGDKRGKPRNRTSHSFRRGFEFVDDYDDNNEFEPIFRAAFGGGRFYWSFIDDEHPFMKSSSYSGNYRTPRGWKYHYEEEYEDYYDPSSETSRGRKYRYEDEYADYDTSSEYERPRSDTSSDRLALGLSPSGPLNLKDVKSAYRSCALKWHPDRHNGSSKEVAEEKFKVCSAAYQSLCDKLALH